MLTVFTQRIITFQYRNKEVELKMTVCHHPHTLHIFILTVLVSAELNLT